MIADDCTFRDIGCYGGQAYTPNIDRLATEGMRMTHCFQCAPMCSPTRHNIYTGQYPVKTGAYPNHTATYRNVKNVTHFLKPLGYRVALSGKTHIGPRDVFRFEYSGKKNPDMKAVDELFAECADSETPFCLFACSNEPHSPWDKGDASRYPPEDVKLPPYLADTPELRDAFSRYLAEITYYDSQVGELLAMLEKHKLAEDTLVMVVSEQGNGFPFAKWTCYDSGLQSAMIVRWPGKVAPGSVTDAMVEYVDVTPTFVDIAGGEPHESLDGKSFLPVLTGKADEQQAVRLRRNDHPRHHQRQRLLSDSIRSISDPQVDRELQARSNVHQCMHAVQRVSVDRCRGKKRGQSGTTRRAKVSAPTGDRVL